MIVHPEAVAEAAIKDGFMHIGYGSYYTLVMPQLDYIPLNVLEQLNRFEEAGGKILWIDDVPRAAEHAKNDEKVKLLLKNVASVNSKNMVSSINDSYAAEFDLNISPGTDKLTIGRFHKNKEQVYLLINRTQEAITIDIEGQRSDGKSNHLKVLDPSTGKIKSVSLSTQVKIKGNRALLLIPSNEYLEQPLIKK